MTVYITTELSLQPKRYELIQCIAIQHVVYAILKASDGSFTTAKLETIKEIQDEPVRLVAGTGTPNTDSGYGPTDTRTRISEKALRRGQKDIK